MNRPSLRTLPLVALALAAAACSDVSGPDAKTPEPTPSGPTPLAVVSCNANVQNGTVSCGSPNTGGVNAAVLVGGQHLYVDLTSSGIAVTADTFAFDATITNLIPQPMGTTDFNTANPNGIRVFFLNGPTASGGSGAVTVANADGTGTFTAAGQPYFQYNGILETDSTSAAKRWKIQFAPGVTSFTFQVAISTEVPYPDGYILGNPYVLTLDPSEARTLPGTVYSFVGNALPGETITWTSGNPALVSVTGNQATAGTTRGFTEITAESGPRPADYTTAVSVCQSVVVASGHTSSQSIASSDCFSAFGSNQFRPSTSYYGDLYRVSLTAGQVVTITLDTGDNLDTYLVLADPNGFPVAVNDDDDDGLLGVGSKIEFQAETTGVYVFEASTFNGLDTGNYNLAVTIN